MESIQPDARHRWEVVGENELLDREATIFRDFSNLRSFRRGHPCWRKITALDLAATVSDDHIVFTVPTLETYGVAVLSPSQVPLPRK